MKPDPERLRPIKELPLPRDINSLRRALGMFSYYSKWTVKYSEKVTPPKQTNSFPLFESVEKAFKYLKAEIENATVNSIDEAVPLTVVTDASYSSIAASLNQSGRQ